MNRLLRIGFQPVGNWELNNNHLTPVINRFASSRNLIYCFVVNAEVKYVGITTKTLTNRMGQYAAPGPTQSTNIRINHHLRECLGQGDFVEIFAFIDPALVHYGEFRVNLALGLEPTLIQAYRPAWNLRHNQEPVQVEDFVLPEQPEPVANEPVDQNFQINVIDAYLKGGFINVPKEFEDSFNEDNQTIDIVFSDQHFQGRFTRNKPNGQLRILAGRELSIWLRDNFEIGEMIHAVKNGDTLTLSRN